MVDHADGFGYGGRRNVHRLTCCGLIVTVLAITGFVAPIHARTSCANFLAIDGVGYGQSWSNNDATLGRPLTDKDLGPVYRRVEENLKSWVEKPGHDNLFDPDYCGSDDNFATDLPLGTPLHEVRGYDLTFRLPARLPDGLIVLFDAFFDPSATTGGELFDIENRVATVQLTTREGKTLAEIDDAEMIDRLIGLMTTAPIEDTDLRSRQESSLTVIYYLDDGTVADDHWFSDTGELLSGIQAPEEYSDVLRAALSAAGTPVAGASGA